MFEFFNDWLETNGVKGLFSDVLTTLFIIGIIALVSYLSYKISKVILQRTMKHFVEKSKTRWDDVLLKRGFFVRLSMFFPAFVIYGFSSAFADYQDIIQRCVFSYMIFVSLLTLNAFLNAFTDMYSYHEVSRQRPIKGYVQVFKIFFAIIAVISIVGTLINKPFGYLIGGIGAMTAVFSLVFKDTILGFVASIQLSANDMVRIGDWIEMPKYDADGEIIDISLNTVKVQNWDKTITTIPPYALISDSFKNWRGMQASGGRRIKRSIFIDMTSIKFCDEQMIKKFSEIRYISEYIASKVREIEEYNKLMGADNSNPVNSRRLTNVGTFRIYILEYLKRNPRLRKDMTLMVRQLANNERGLPLEIYAFTDTIIWVEYEAIQSDIFDHILAVLPMFELKLFQNPTGNEFKILH